jgi:hypothetical protein
LVPVALLSYPFPGSRMAKSDRDPRDDDRSRSARTEEDVVPPVHVLEAAQAQERKETDDLLAGFDKPGKAPRRRRGSEDFVDYYAKEPGTPTAEIAFPPPPERAPASRPPPDASAQAKTRIIPRGSRLPEWVPIALTAAGISLVVVVIALVATREPTPARPPIATATATIATATATIATATIATTTTATPPAEEPSGVAPPPQPEPSASAPTPAFSIWTPPSSRPKLRPPHKTDVTDFTPP